MQGVFPPGTFGQLELSGNWYGAVEWQYPPHQRQGAYEEEGRAINTLKVCAAESAVMNVQRCFASDPMSIGMSVITV